MVDPHPPKMRAMHFSNTLHTLGHELYADLTDDFERRNAANRFEELLRAPVNQAKLDRHKPKPSFPVHQDLGAQCGDCAIQNIKKPVRRIHPNNYRESSRRLVKRREMVSTTETSSLAESSHHSRRVRKYGVDHSKDKEDSSSFKASLLRGSDDSITVDEKSEYLPCGYRRQIRVHRTRHGRASADPDEPKPQNSSAKADESSKKEVKVATAKEASPPKAVTPPPVSPSTPLIPVNFASKEPAKLDCKKKSKKCRSAVLEEGIQKGANETQLYASTELHCAAENAVKSVDKTVAALEKLIILSPKDSVNNSIIKTLTLMCVFLRQFHTELRSRRDRKSKLEAILRIWQHLHGQAQASQPMLPAVNGPFDKGPALSAETPTIKPSTSSPTNKNLDWNKK